ncbi:MAG: cryptochrome/photolyase family protein [Desulfobaccales bacterium]
MSRAVLVLPHQLFEPHPALSRDKVVYLLEAPRYFSEPEVPLRFHRQKLALHRAGLKAFYDRLSRRGYEVQYLEYAPHMEMAGLWERLRRDGIEVLELADPVDHLMTNRLAAGAEAGGLKLIIHESPAFLCSRAEIQAFFKDTTHFRQTSFYIQQRKKRGLLLEGNKPWGGRWTFDTENRRRLPKNLAVPPPPTVTENDFHREARAYVNARFTDHPGRLEACLFPVTHEEARTWLQEFLEHRLARFGDYEDAISARHPVIFHSLLSPLLNTGLLTPHQVLVETLAWARERPVPLNCLEGFVRQIIGWREYVRAVYLLAGERQRQANFFGHRRSLPPGFYDAATGVLPLDTVIRRVLDTGYAHHIERLMVLGNFLLLCEVDPREVYRWFMELFIDSYDWVMVPNVFGMSQFADGGLMMTKPYFSSSNYLRKMSDFPEGEWCARWDALYWRFVDKNRDYLATNPRLVPMLRYLERLAPERRRQLLKTAKDYLAAGTD